MSHDNPLPDGIISEVLSHYPEAMLMGAHARDYIVNTKAGLQEGRATNDLDLAIAVPSLASFRQKAATLQPHGDTGMRFRIRGHPVDLIPFPPDASNGIIEVTEGIQMDVTGIAEAFGAAEYLSSPYEGLRVPTLHAMIVLKTVAWNMRRRATNKDAQDLALLMKCVDVGAYEDRCYGDELAHFDGDPQRVGAYLTGRDALRDLPNAVATCRDVWMNPDLPSAMASGSGRRTYQVRYARLLRDLVEGSEERSATTPGRGFV